MGFPGSSDGKESPCNVGDLGLSPGLGRSPGEGKSYPLQHSCLQNSVDRGAWQATVHGVTNSILFIIIIFKSFLALLCGMWDLSSLTRHQTHISCIGRKKS